MGSEIRTAEHFLLVKYEEMERERDEAVAYADGVRAAEEAREAAERERIADIERRCAEEVVLSKEELVAVRYEVAGSYILKSTDYGFGDPDELSRALAMDDDGLLEWASDVKEKGRYATAPIERREGIFDYVLRHGTDVFASIAENPSYFISIAPEPVTGRFLEIGMDAAARSAAIAGLRKNIRFAIELLEGL